ncbi:hypothetical protein [Pseudorhodobacter aquimaris]|uniref:hypothetical protein n=1 Tax=Pseudorhodobacter aquimaris TaxID=687412 RepID=UPI00067C40E1|nr:hypothetical protein [Pseudorhodobacter aquimaris]
MTAFLPPGGTLVWTDPPVSVGFTYEVTGGSLITSVTAPSSATVADIDGYTLIFGASDFALAAGATYTFVGAGIDFLTLSGIDTSLSLDPTEPLAVAVVITPITEDIDGPSPVPLPASGLLYFGAVLLAGRAFCR